MAVVALVMGRSRRGLGRPRAFSFQAPRQTKREGRERAEEERGGRHVSLAAVLMKLRHRNKPVEDLLGDWRGSSGSSL